MMNEKKSKLKKNRRNPFWAPALLLTLLSLSFTFEAQQAVWLWAKQPTVAVILGVMALVAWLAFGRHLWRNRTIGS